MIHPFLNMTIFGAIWYQGEANSNAPDTYNCTFPAMIDDWRQKWFLGSDGNTNKTFPFGFVQVVTTFLMFVGIQDIENLLYILFCRKNPDLLLCRSKWLFPGYFILGFPQLPQVLLRLPFTSPRRVVFRNILRLIPFLAFDTTVFFIVSNIISY